MESDSEAKDSSVHELDDRAFLAERVQPIPGWLFDFAALRTMELLSWQDEQSITGSFLEIGVYCGRYFSLLLRAGSRTGATVVGIDTFQFSSPALLREHMERAVGSVDFKLIERPSTSVTAKAVLAVTGGRPRFISIDGSHAYKDVLWDLRLSESILATGGVIAADDFISPECLGVNQAINEFLSLRRDLAPFAYFANKLFLCRRRMHQRYIELMESLVLADKVDVRSLKFIEHRKSGRTNCFTHFHGDELLVAG